MKAGDGNTKYFHKYASQWRRLNKISRLVCDGVEVTEEVKGWKPDWVDGDLRSIPSDLKEQLNEPFTEAETKAVMFKSEGDKAPSPDGFGFQFYKQFWTTLKEDLLQMFTDFQMGGKGIGCLNASLFVLIPKKEGPTTLGDYRPICLMDSSYMLVAKVLANCLKWTESQKPCMVKWESICLPRSKGGLGVLDLNAMNKALLSKWLWQWQATPSALWVRLLWERYDNGGCMSRFPIPSNRMTFLCRSWFILAQEFNQSFKWQLGKGDQILFWRDKWCGDSPFCMGFPNIFQIAEDKEATVNAAWSEDDDWRISFEESPWIGKWKNCWGCWLDSTKSVPLPKKMTSSFGKETLHNSLR
ncbi:hypothetical protein QJS10_CPA08g00761 [Acorus calamus]|uniref:Uncharacterized protein n=1 Tax=Acorus calamus TaxID=4465 RepID=A0AAV9E8W1_ACOCL|nr:hypothetical protein QJS10_CPA08g00761 [Acorus calamus]